MHHIAAFLNFASSRLARVTLTSPISITPSVLTNCTAINSLVGRRRGLARCCFPVLERPWRDAVGMPHIIHRGLQTTSADRDEASKRKIKESGGSQHFLNCRDAADQIGRPAVGGSFGVLGAKNGFGEAGEGAGFEALRVVFHQPAQV